MVAVGRSAGDQLRSGATATQRRLIAIYTQFTRKGFSCEKVLRTERRAVMSYDVGRGPYQGGGNSGYVARDAQYQREDPLVSSLKENIKQISNNVTSITKFATSLGTPKDSAENRAKLYVVIIALFFVLTFIRNATIETTKQIAKTATQQMKDLGNNARGTPDERNVW